ncbi:unnamed protein product [Linum trigynum]|uniref:PB1-like domain-containing protein n=1 Tax=Linum trigynum TaxID=586398 RepID=A0AAV2DEF4_9ROSI
MPRCGGLRKRKRKVNQNSNENQVEEDSEHNIVSQSHSSNEIPSTLRDSSNPTSPENSASDIPSPRNFNAQELTIKYHYGGHFTFSPRRQYTGGSEMVKDGHEVDFLCYFTILDDLKACGFNILDGDKFYYLKPRTPISDLNGLVRVNDDDDVSSMLSSYKKHMLSTFEIYTLSRKHDILPNESMGEEIPLDSDPHDPIQPSTVQEPELNPSGSHLKKKKTRGPTRCMKIIELEEGRKLPVDFDEDHQAIGENATSFVWFLGVTVRNRSCCPLQVKRWKDISNDAIEHMWAIVQEKFTFELPMGRMEAIIGHMNALYRDHRQKLKQKYFNKKHSYKSRLKNRPKRVSKDDWKYLVNLWSDPTFQERSLKNKENRSKRSMPPYTGTKSLARLRHQMKKQNGTVPSRVEVWIESRKRKKGKTIDPDSQDVISQLDQLKKQRAEGVVSMNDEEMFEKVLGPEKNGYVRAYGPGKGVTEFFGVKPTKAALIKQVEAARKEASEQVEQAKKEANERVDKITRDVEKQMADMNKKWEEKFKILLSNTRSSAPREESNEEVSENF